MAAFECDAMEALEWMSMAQDPRKLGVPSVRLRVGITSMIKMFFANVMMCYNSEGAGQG